MVALAVETALLMGFVDARPLAAQTPGAENASIDELRQTVEELQRAVGERDAAIVELLQRMKALEGRLANLTTMEPALPPPGPSPPAPERSQGAVAPQDANDQVVAQEARPEAPGQIQVDEEAVSTALERALVQEGALLLPPGTVQVGPNLSYARREANAVSIEVQDGQQVVSVGRVRQDDLTAGLGLRFGLPFGSQISIDLPYQYRETKIAIGGRDESRHEDGFDDVIVSLSKGLMRERGWRPDLVAEVTWDSASAQTFGGVGLGSGFNEVSAGVTASKSQDPLVFVGGLFYDYTFEDDGVQPGDGIGFSLGTVLAASPETSLRFFLDQRFSSKSEVDGEQLAGSDEAIGVFRVGGSALLTSRMLLDLDVGIGLTDDAPDYVISVSLPIQFNLPFIY